MKTRRISGGLLAAGLVTLFTAAPGLAEESQITIIPADPGTAEATAVELGPIRIGHAQAQAGPEGSEADSSATGNSVELNDKPLAAQFGGTQKGKGPKKRGQLVEAADARMGSIRVAPWDAEVGDREGGGTRADSSAALLEIIGNGVFRIDVARGEAHAEHDGKDSKGWAVSDGGRLYVGPENELEVIVLHAESRSDNTGSTYLVGLNGTEIGSDEQLSRCPVSVPSVVNVNLNCVAATGGQGTVKEVTAGVLKAGFIPVDGVVAASNTAGRSAEGSSTDLARAPEPAPIVPAELPAAAPPALLPRTGSGLGFMAAVGAAMTALGMAILAIGRRASALT